MQLAECVERTTLSQVQILPVEVLPAAVGVGAQRIEVAREGGERRLLVLAAARQPQGHGAGGGAADELAPRPPVDLALRLVVAHGVPPARPDASCATAVC